MKNNRTLVTLSRTIDTHEWIICISDVLNRVTIPCIQLEWSRPFYGTELSKEQIMDLIEFFQQTLKGREDVERETKSNLE
jgi:hypothetical protein